MKVESIVCDKCNKTPARAFYIFKDRVADGAGGMENISYIFDLCSDCCARLLGLVFEEPKFEGVGCYAIGLVENFGVKVRAQ